MSIGPGNTAVTCDVDLCSVTFIVDICRITFVVDLCSVTCVVDLCSTGNKTQPESKCPELLANYCDMLLRKTPLSKKLTSEEVERKLREVVTDSFCSFL